MSNNIVLSSYFSFLPDPQRNETWTSDIAEVFGLAFSVTTKNEKIVIFHDCFENTYPIDNCEWRKVEHKDLYAPNIIRYFHYYDYLKNLKNKPKFVFMVDSTDVVMLKNPFLEMKKNIIYVGQEEGKNMDDTWLISHKRLSKFHIEDYHQILKKAKPSNTLINCGTVGSNYDLFMSLLEKLLEVHYKHSKEIYKQSLDTQLFAYTLLKYFSDCYHNSLQVNTPYRSKEINSVSWWKHK